MIDEEQGNVIDGTARTRQWRRLRQKPPREPDASELRSDAPKSIAASLLVPAEMLDVPPATPPGPPLSRNGQPGTATSVAERGSAPDTGATFDSVSHRNLFLSPDAAVVGSPSQPSRHKPTAALRFIKGALARLRGVSEIQAWRPRLTLPRARYLAAALSLVAVVALAAELVAHSHTTSTRLAHGSVGTESVAGLDRLRATVLSALTRAVAIEHAAGRPRATRPRPARRRQAHKPRRAHSAITTAAATPVTSGYTPPPSTGSAASSSTSSSSVGSGTAAPSTSTAQPSSASGGSTSAFGSSGALGPGSSKNG